MTNAQTTTIIVVLLVAVLAGFFFFTPRPANNDGLGSRIDRAAEEVSEGVAGAAKELKPESQKTVGEKVGDAVEDVGKEIRGTNH